jgi:DNA-binding SARP family transcriptional activator
VTLLEKAEGSDGAHLAVAAALARGDLVGAEAALGELRAAPPDSASPVRFASAVAEGLLRLVAGRHDDAARVAEDALTAAAAEGIRAYDAWLYCTVAAAKLCRADSAGARGALSRLDGSIVPLRRGDRACVHYLRAWIAAIDGDLADAHREARTAVAVAIETGIPWFECLARIEVVQMQSDGADRRGAEAQLRTAAAIAERLRSAWLSYAVGLATAGAHRIAGVRQATLDALRASLQLGRENGFRAPLGWPPQALGELCATALGAGIEPELARALVRDGKLAPAALPLRVRRWPWPFRIVTLGGFRCLRTDAVVELSGKGPGRPMELLKVLVALGRHEVRADQLADALWPNAEADYAYKSFAATLHRLRRALDEDDVLVLRDGRLSLNRTLVWIDTWALEQLCDDFDAALRGADACRDEGLRDGFLAEALELYRGPFLPDESEQPSYIACREHVRARLLRFLGRIARGFEEAGSPERAADCWLRFIEADEICEPLHRQLILCLKRSGATGEAAAAYERLRTILAARLKTMPSPELQGLYASLGVAGTAR